MVTRQINRKESIPNFLCADIDTKVNNNVKAITDSPSVVIPPEGKSGARR